MHVLAGSGYSMNANFIQVQMVLASLDLRSVPHM